MGYVVYDPDESCIWGYADDPDEAFSNAETNIRDYVGKIRYCPYCHSNEDKAPKRFMLDLSDLPDELILREATQALLEQVRNSWKNVSFVIHNGIADIQGGNNEPTA